MRHRRRITRSRLEDFTTHCGLSSKKFVRHAAGGSQTIGPRCIVDVGECFSGGEDTLVLSGIASTDSWWPIPSKRAISTMVHRYATPHYLAVGLAPPATSPVPTSGSRDSLRGQTRGSVAPHGSARNRPAGCHRPLLTSDRVPPPRSIGPRALIASRCRPFRITFHDAERQHKLSVTSIKGRVDQVAGYEQKEGAQPTFAGIAIPVPVSGFRHNLFLFVQNTSILYNMEATRDPQTFRYATCISHSFWNTFEKVCPRSKR